MSNIVCRRTQGRASCWLIGGLGCLGLVILAVVALYFLGRAGAGLVQPVMQAMERGQKVLVAQRAAYDAIRLYAAANNGKYPKSLKELTPKYTNADLTAPITLEDGTKITLVYKPPQPNAAPDTVILEHKPPITATMNAFGTKITFEYTYQIQLDGKAWMQQVTIDEQGNKQIQRIELEGSRPRRN